MIHKICLYTLFSVVFNSAQAAQSIEGRVLERGTRTPLANVNVFVLPHKLKATTDAQGAFKIESVPDGKFEWVVNLTGYEKLTQEDELSSSGEATPEVRTLYIEKSSYQSYETTVTGKQKQRDDSLRSLKREVFTQMPGSRGDPLLAVQNMPGINRPGFGSAQVVIQGSAPQDTRYTIDQHEVPIMFHFGNFSSVILPEALDRIDYYSAGYGPEFSRAMGGLIGASTKTPRKDRLGGMAFVDLINSGAALEGPVGSKGSFMIGGRQSYIGAVLAAVVKNNDSFNLTVAPTFADGVAVYETPLSDQDDFKVVTVGSSDRLQFLLSKPSNQDPSIRGTFDNRTKFFRLIPQWTHRFSERTTSKFSLAGGKDITQIDIGENYFHLDSWALTARGEIEHKATELWTTQLGYDNRYAWADVDVSLPVLSGRGGVTNPISSAQRRTASLSAKSNAVGAYWRNEIRLGSESRWSILPSIRADYFTLSKQLLAGPRFAARFQWDETLKFKLGSGLYHQPPTEQQASESFGNPDIQAPRAYHLSLGFEKDLRGGSNQGWTVGSGTFYRYFDRLIIPSSNRVTRNGEQVAEVFNNGGQGQAYGAEALVRVTERPWEGWVTYTLSRSTRWENGGDPHLFQYDQTHLLTMIGAVSVSGNWRFSTRFRYVTGNPQTPITGGVFDSDSDAYLPVRGEIYSSRLSPFSQLDIRIDKKWILKTWILSAYLDIYNATNRKNPEAIRYNYDYTEQAEVTGLPIIPTIGVKGEF